MSQSQMTPEERPDVDAVMNDIRRRVAEKKAAGIYSVDALAESGGRVTPPYRADDLAEVARLSDVMPNYQLVRSTKPGIGAIVGKLKSGLSRATSQPLIGVADQASGFNAALVSYISELAQEVAVLRKELDELRAGLSGPGA